MKKKGVSKKPVVLSAYSIIQKKRDGLELVKEEIQWFIENLTNGTIPDYQMTALLMAIYLRGLNSKETQYLTDAMLYSGKVLDFKDKKVIDKHSTGGVGDKTSFILGPIAAACGVKVPMIAGRGLGHTGGTVDKIEAMTGFNTSLTLEQFSEYLYKHGIVLIGQTKDIAPADKKIYGLRDVTATVESIPLITASIMSKKLAEGAAGIVMDVKCGPGAFMKNLKDARALAKSISDTGVRFNKSVITMITDMTQPLGNAIGNSLEIIESIETLKGRGPADLTKLSLDLAGGMVYLAGISKTFKDGVKMAKEALDSGRALDKFRELVGSQGGDPTWVDDYSKFPMAQVQTQVKAPKNGFIAKMQCEELGLKCVQLGGGRKAAGESIDFGVGFILHKKLGDKISKGEALVTIFHHESQADMVKKMSAEFTKDLILISGTKPKKIPPLVYEMTTKMGKK